MRQPHARRIEPARPESRASLALGLAAILMIVFAVVVLLPATAWQPVVP